MNVSIRIPLPLIEKSLNQAFETMIYEGNTQLEAGGQVNIHVRKTAPIQLFPQGSEIQANVPVEIKARMQRNDPSLIHILREFSNLEKIKLQIRFQLFTRFSIAENWELIPETRLTYSWEKKPTIGMGLLQIPVPRIVENILDNELASIEKLLNDEIAAAIALPTLAKNIWAQFLQPIAIPAEIPIWLSLNPSVQSVKISPVRCEQKDLMVKTQLPLEPMIRVVAPVDSSSKDLPLVESTVIQSGISVFPLLGVLSYKELSEISKGKKFPVGKSGQIKLESVVFECRTPDHLHVLASVSGKIPISGRLVKMEGECEIVGEFNSGSQKSHTEITLISFKWLKAQWWNRMGTKLLNMRLKAYLAEAFNQWLKSEISLAERTIRKELANYSIDEYSTLKGEISTFYLKEILPKQEKLELRFQVETNLEVVIKAFQLPTLKR